MTFEKDPEFFHNILMGQDIDQENSTHLRCYVVMLQCSDDRQDRFFQAYEAIFDDVQVIQHRVLFADKQQLYC
jgi:hypothetical protein